MARLDWARTAMRGLCVPGVLLTLVTLAGCGNIVKNTTVVVSTPSRGASLVPYRVPAGSMEPTLSIGDVVWAEPPPFELHLGDIVVLSPPDGAEQEECGPTPHTVKLGGAACSEPVPTPSGVKFIKRIAAGPGDEIYISEGHVYRRSGGSGRFNPESDSYIKECGASPECNFPVPIKIPAGHWFVMGDNRGESDDSRFWGPVPTPWITGRVKWCRTIDTLCPGS